VKENCDSFSAAFIFFSHLGTEIRNFPFARKRQNCCVQSSFKAQRRPDHRLRVQPSKRFFVDFQIVDFQIVDFKIIDFKIIDFEIIDFEIINFEIIAFQIANLNFDFPLKCRIHPKHLRANFQFIELTQIRPNLT
jgi:hypothetical protein